MRTVDGYEVLRIALFRGPIGAVVDAAELALKAGLEQGRYTRTVSPLRLDTVYVKAPPYNAPRRAVFFEPASATGTTALVSNAYDGWLTLVNILAVSTSFPTLLLTSNVRGDSLGEAFGFWSAGVHVRHVHALKEGAKWVFYSKGSAQPFENPTVYKKHRIHDRLNRAILLGYALALGWNLGSEEFWVSNRDATYFMERDSNPTQPRAGR